MRSAMLAPPPARLLSEKSVLSYAYLNTTTVYPRYRRKSSIYLSGYRLHMYGPAHYIFFASTLYLFGDHISPRSQLYWEQREEMKVTCIETQQSGAIMSIFKIALLGPPAVHHRARRLTCPDRTALTPLAYLASAGCAHDRQQ